MEAPFNYIQQSLNIPKAVANECSRSGDNEYSVNYYMNLPKYKKQLEKNRPSAISKRIKRVRMLGR